MKDQEAVLKTTNAAQWDQENTEKVHFLNMRQAATPREARWRLISGGRRDGALAPPLSAFRVHVAPFRNGI